MIQLCYFKGNGDPPLFAPDFGNRLFTVGWSYFDVSELPEVAYQMTMGNEFLWTGTFPPTCYISTAFCQVDERCPTDQFSASETFSPTVVFAPTAAPKPTGRVDESKDVGASPKLEKTSSFTASDDLRKSLAVGNSVSLDPTDGNVQASAPLRPSEIGPTEGHFLPASAPLTPSESFAQSRPGAKTNAPAGSEIGRSAWLVPSGTFARTFPFTLNRTLPKVTGGGEGPGSSSSAAGAGSLSLTMLAGIVGGGLVLAVIVVILLVKFVCRPGGREVSSDANELAVGVLETETTVGADVTGDTMYYVTEANALATEVAIDFQASGDSGENAD
jgi:hypothetical protein